MKIQLLLPVLAFLVACGNNKPGEKENNNATAQQDGPGQTPAATTPVDAGKDGNVSFRVNDTLARTQKTTGGDTDDNLGLFTEKGAFLSFGLYGDVPERPHRGWLEFSLKGFKFEPGTYTLSADNYARFTRYETINAGGETNFEAFQSDLYKGTEMTISFSSLTPDPESFNGRDWLASGTFRVKLQNKVYSPAERKNGTQTIDITEGKFERIRIAGGPSAK